MSIFYLTDIVAMDEPGDVLDDELMCPRGEVSIFYLTDIVALDEPEDVLDDELRCQSFT